MTVRTRAQLNSDADTNLADNTAGDISAADVRQGAKDIADSALLAEDIGVSVQAYAANLTEWATLNPSANAGSLVVAADYAAMRALLDLEAGTDFYSIAAANAAFQPIDADLTSWAGVTRAAGFDTFAATPSSANLASLVTGETGSGALVFATSPTLVTPALGTPSALVLTNATGLTSSGVAAATLVTAAEGLASSDNDTSWPTTAAVIDAIAAGGGGGMTLLGTLTTTSGTAQSLTGLSLGSYKYLVCILKDVSLTSASALTLALSSTNGSAYGTAGAVTGTLNNSSNVFLGKVEVFGIDNTNANRKFASSNARYIGGTNGDASVTSVQLPTDTGAVVNALQFSGGTFDGGSIDVYGVK